MKKVMLIAMCAAMILSSCNSTGEGAYVGSQMGHVLGSSIGGLAGGWRGHHIGALAGTLGGAVAGAAIGSAAEKKHNREVEERMSRRNGGYGDGASRNGGYQNRQQSQVDDRIDFAASESPLEVRHATIVEGLRDGVLTRGEECTVVFEIFNTSDYPVYNVKPFVKTVERNSHVRISPSLLVKTIDPRQGIRYKATLQADNRLRDGELHVIAGVGHEGVEIVSQTRRFTVPTAKGHRR